MLFVSSLADPGSSSTHRLSWSPAQPSEAGAVILHFQDDKIKAQRSDVSMPGPSGSRVREGHVTWPVASLALAEHSDEWV